MITLTRMLETFPGIGCAWSDPDGNTAAEYRGMADKERNIPVDGNTIFPACSISKFVTAICLMILRDRKELDTDAPVNEYLHRWKLLTTEGKESGTSVMALMCHTAGIVDGEDSFYGLRLSDPLVSLTDILEGKTAYNDRPVRTEQPPGTAFEYSDAGYCVLQLLIQDVTRKAFEDAARDLLFDRLSLNGTFFASPGNIARFAAANTMAAGYDSESIPIPGKWPQVPDLAASGLWSTPAELLSIAREFILALNGRSDILKESSAIRMAEPVDRFPWAGAGLFLNGRNILVSRGWGENGQCMMKADRSTGEISVVMTNRDPGVDQAESGVEQLVDSRLTGTE